LAYATDDEEVLTSTYLSRKRREEMKRIRLEICNLIKESALTIGTSAASHVSPLYRKILDELALLPKSYSHASFKDCLTEEEQLELDKKIEEICKDINPLLDNWEDRIVWDESQNSRLSDPNMVKGLYAAPYDINDDNQSNLTSFLLSMWKPVSLAQRHNVLFS
jgi:hypothetical protein